MLREIHQSAKHNGSALRGGFRGFKEGEKPANHPYAKQDVEDGRFAETGVREESVECPKIFVSPM